MTEPLHWLHIGQPQPEVVATARDPFVVHPAPDLDHAWPMLERQPMDAIVLHADTAALRRLLNEGARLDRLCHQAALLVLTPEREPDPDQTLELMRRGTQAVLSAFDLPPLLLSALVRQAIERQRRLHEARRTYSTDLATGLPNEAQLREHLTHLVALREREPAAMAALVIEVQGVALGVQALGMEAGNVLRRKVAVRLRSCLRASDVVAALGEDRYAVLLAWLDEAAAARRVADKVAATLGRAFQVAGHELRLGCRIGLAQFPSEAADAESLLRLAAAAAAGSVALGPKALGTPAVVAPRGGDAAND